MFDETDVSIGYRPIGDNGYEMNDTFLLKLKKRVESSGYMRGTDKHPIVIVVMTEPLDDMPEFQKAEHILKTKSLNITYAEQINEMRRKGNLPEYFYIKIFVGEWEMKFKIPWDEKQNMFGVLCQHTESIDTETDFFSNDTRWVGRRVVFSGEFRRMFDVGGRAVKRNMQEWLEYNIIRHWDDD